MGRASVVAICVVAVSACASTWQLEHPFLYGGDIHAMTTVDTVAIAVGPRGTLLRSNDTGGTWRTLASGTVANLKSIAHSDGLWIAVGDDGTVLRSRDGVAFERRAAPSSEPLVGVAVAGPLVIAAAENGSLLRSQDGGETFETLPGLRAALSDLLGSTHGSRSASAIAIDASGVLLGTALGLWRSTDRGARFARITDEPIQAINVASNGIVYALAGEAVYYSPRAICNTCIGTGYVTVALYRGGAGATWERRTIDDPTHVVNTWERAKRPTPPASAPRHMWPRIGWTEQGFHGPEVWAPLDPRSLMLGPRGTLFVGVQGHRYLSTNRGDTIREITERDAVLWAGTGTVVDATALGGRRVPSERLTALATSEDQVYAVGHAGAILKRTPSGWRALTTPTPTSALRAVSVLARYSSSDVIAVGDDGTILSSRNGETFERCSSGTSADLTVVVRGGDVSYAAGRGTFLRSRGYGCDWEATTTTTGTPTALWGWMGDLYLVDGGIHRSRDGGKTWTERPKPDGHYRAGLRWYDDMFLVGDAGKLARSRDNGTTWTRLASGTAMDLRAIWGDNEDLYIGGGNAGGGCVVMRSRDRGDSWHEEPVDCQQPVLAITGSEKHVWILSDGNPSTIWRGKQ